MEHSFTQDYLYSFAKKAESPVEMKQLHAMVVTFCITRDIEVDTYQWDFLIDDLFSRLSPSLLKACAMSRKRTFDLKMSSCLV